MSRFDDLLKTARKRPGTPEPSPGEAPGPAGHAHPAGEPPPPAPPHEDAPRGRGRPRGKRSDPAFEQVSAYIPRELYGRVRAALWQDPARPEFSALITELLAAWLEDRHGG